MRKLLNFDERPLLVFLELTKACPLQCIHCRASAITRPLPDELSTREVMRLLEEITEFGRPYPTVIFTGGDPMARDDALELIDYAHGLGLRVGVAPTATESLLDNDVIELFREVDAAVSISLDGTELTHNLIRRAATSTTSNVYRTTVNIIREYVRRGINVQVNTTVMKINVHELPHVLKQIVDLNVRTWEVFFLIRVGRGTDVEDLSSRECEDVLNFLYDVEQSLDLTIRVVEAPFYRRIKLHRRFLERIGVRDPARALGLGYLYRSLRDCVSDVLRGGAARRRLRDVVRIVPVRDGCGIIFVSSVGDVYPSGFAPYPLGSVRKTSVVKIYRESDVLRKIRRAEFRGRCGICEFRFVCGGSRARAYSYHNDILGDDPSCSYAPRSFAETVKRIRHDVSTTLAGG